MFGMNILILEKRTDLRLGIDSSVPMVKNDFKYV